MSKYLQIEQRVKDHLIKHGKDRKYREIAELYNFLPHLSNDRRAEKVRSLWRGVKRTSKLDLNGIDEFRYNNPNLFITNEEYHLLNQVSKDQEYNEFLAWKARKHISAEEIDKLILSNLPKPYKGNPDNVLIIGDIHEPFSLPGYLEWVREKQEQFDCGTVIFIGDVIDSYYESFYDKAIDAPITQQEERQKALNGLKRWYTVFPNAIITKGNHTLRYIRKATKIGLHEDHFKPINEILEAPDTWKFVEEVIINNVLYRHGATGHAFPNAMKERMSVVEGDKHTLGYVQWSSSRKDSIFGMQVGCVDAETEYLTPTGWKRIANYNNELVGQYNEDGTVEFIKPNAFIKLPEQKLYHIKNKYGLEMKLCSNHDIVYRMRYSGKLKKIKTLDLIRKHKENKQGFHQGFPCTFEINHNDSLNLSDDELRLQVAFMADGTIVKKKGVIQVKKDRKKKRLKMLLDSLNINYNQSDYSNGISRFKFTPPLLIKSFCDNFWYKASKEQLKIIAFESLLWDGDQKKEFISKDKCDVDFIQYAFNANGYRTHIRHDTRENKESYSVTISLKKKDRYISTKGDKDIFTEIETTDGYKYCFNVPSGMLVLRCNNSIFITGNCGLDFDSFVFNYAKNSSKRPVIGCGVVLDRGQTPIFLKMNK